MTQAGAAVKEEVVRALIVLISNAPELHGYAVRAFYKALDTHLDRAEFALIMAATWLIGGSPAHSRFQQPLPPLLLSIRLVSRARLATLPSNAHLGSIVCVSKCILHNKLTTTYLSNHAGSAVPKSRLPDTAGEFGELLMPGAAGYILAGEAAVNASPDNVVQLLRRVITRPDLPIAAREYALTALMKLSARLPGVVPSVQVSGRRLVQCSYM